MSKARTYFATITFILLVAVVGAVLRYGFPPRGEGARILGAIIFVGGIAAAVVLIQNSRVDRR